MQCRLWFKREVASDPAMRCHDVDKGCTYKREDELLPNDKDNDEKLDGLSCNSSWMDSVSYILWINP